VGGSALSALIRMSISLIRPVQLPVIPDAKESGNALNYLLFVAQEGQKIGLKSPISLFFSLLPGSGPPETGLRGPRAPPGSPRKTT